jgi:hypothetical protein
MVLHVLPIDVLCGAAVCRLVACCIVLCDCLVCLRSLFFAAAFVNTPIAVFCVPAGRAQH